MKFTIPIYFWFPVFGCVVGATFFMNIPPVVDQFMNLFGVGYAGLSVLLSILYWPHSLCQVPGGLVVDRLGAMRSLLVCLAVMIATNLIPLLAPESLSLAIAMRAALGLVTGAYFLTMMKIIKILTPPTYIARMQGAHGAAFCIGTLMPYLYLPPTGSYGWIAAYLSGVILCVAVGLCMFRLPWERLRETRDTISFSQTMRAMKEIATSKTIWLIGCCHGFFFGTINAFGNWLPSILADIRANSTAEDWALATGAMLLLGALARMFGSEIMGLMTRWQLITRTMLLIGISYWILAFCGNATLFLCLCLLLALFCGLTFASVFMLLLEIAPPAYVFSATGFMTMLANIVNTLLILLWGTVREYTGSFSYGLCLSGIWALLIWWWARKQNPEEGLTGREEA